MLTALLIGVMAHFLVFRPLRNAAPLGKVIGSLGTMIYLQGVALKNFGSDNPNPKAVLPRRHLQELPVDRSASCRRKRFYLAVFAVVVGAAVWVFFQYTRFGLATRAAAGNEKGAVLLGYSPERLALTNWILSAVLAGLAGVFVGLAHRRPEPGQVHDPRRARPGRRPHRPAHLHPAGRRRRSRHRHVAVVGPVVAHRAESGGRRSSRSRVPRTRCPS